MTENELTRGREIQEELGYLQSSLSQLNKAQFFSCDEGSRCFGTRADGFLSELHIKLKKDGVNAITSKIKLLEKEFKSL
jgi:hypothetical protein